MGDKRQRPCAKSASSRHRKGQEFYNDGERDPAIDTGARLTRIVGHDQSVVIFQQLKVEPSDLLALLAQRGHSGWRNECRLSGVKRTFTKACVLFRASQRTACSDRCLGRTRVLTLSGATRSLIKLTGSGPGSSNTKLRGRYLSSLMSIKISHRCHHRTPH